MNKLYIGLTTSGLTSYIAITKIKDNKIKVKKEKEYCETMLQKIREMDDYYSALNISVGAENYGDGIYTRNEFLILATSHQLQENKLNIEKWEKESFLTQCLTMPNNIDNSDVHYIKPSSVIFVQDIYNFSSTTKKNT